MQPIVSDHAEIGHKCQQWMMGLATWTLGIMAHSRTILLTATLHYS